MFVHTPYEGMVSEESKIGTTVFKWIHVEDLDKVGEPLEVRCESIFQVNYLKLNILLTYNTNNITDFGCKMPPLHCQMPITLLYFILFIVMHIIPT